MLQGRKPTCLHRQKNRKSEDAVRGKDTFLGATVEEIQDVKMRPGDTLHWEQLDIFLGVDNFVHPHLYPCIGLSPEQLARVREAIKHIKVSEWVVRQLKRFDTQEQ